MNEWLHANGLEQIGEILSNHGLTDLESLLETQYETFVQWGIPKKDRKKLISSIIKYKEVTPRIEKKKEFITTSVDRTCSYGSEDNTPHNKENNRKDDNIRNENDNIIDELGKLDTSNTLSDFDDDQTPRRGRSNSDSSDVRITLKVPNIKRGRSGDRLMFHKKIEGVLSVKKPGFLGLTKRWEPRWCIFDGRRFMAFKSKLETTPLVNIDVTKAIVGSVIGRKGNLNMLEIIAEGKRSLWLGSDIETWINVLEKVSYYDLNSKRRTSEIHTIHDGMSSSEEEKQSLDVATESEDRLAGSTDKFFLDMRKRKYKRRTNEDFNEEFYKKALESYQNDSHIEEDYPSEEMEEDDENAHESMEEVFSVVIIKPNDSEKPKWCKRWCVYDGSGIIKTFDIRDRKNLNASPISIIDLATVSVNSRFLSNNLCIEFVLEDRKEIWKGSNIHHWIVPLEKVAGKNLPPIIDGVLVRRKWRPDGQWIARYCSYNGHQFQIYRRKGDKLPLKMYPSRNCSTRIINSHENIFELIVEGEVKWVWWNGEKSDKKVNWAQIIRERHEKAVSDASRNDPDEFEDESEDEDDTYYHVTSTETMKGTLMVKAQKKIWESKHCELRGRVLFIYKIKGTKKTLELEIKINKANVKVSKSNEKEDRVIEIHHSNNKKIFLKSKDSDKWLDAMKKALTSTKKKPTFIKTFSDLSAAESRSEEKSIGKVKDTEIQESSSP